MAQDGPTDEIVFAKDGTVTLRIGPRRVVTLRRPTLGEFRKLRLLLHDSQDRLQALLDEATEAAQQRQAALDSGNADEAKPLADRALELDRQYTEANEDESAAWMSTTCEVLGDGPLDGEDVPLWAADGQVVAALIRHWRYVPLDHGGS